jgi:type IV pilus assembly protein PilB
LARRFGCDFVDLHRFSLNEEIVSRVPTELMFRFNFLPLEEMPDGRLAISIADPSQLLLIDEISLFIGETAAHPSCSVDSYQ